MTETLKELAITLKEARGVDVSLFDEAFLLRSINRRRAAADAPTTAAYLERLRGDPTEAEAFIASLHVNYSEFFRDPLTFAMLEQVVLPQLLDEARAKSSELRIWSVGCAHGEEPYSVAILLDELAAARGQDLRCRIFATDRSEAGLAAARVGVYTAEVLGNVRKRHLEAYFTRVGDAYSISPRLRAWVEPSTYDLLDTNTTCPPASIYGGFDLILCRNLLLYYRAKPRRAMVKKLHRSLEPCGFLIAGKAEQSIIESTGDFHRAASPAMAVFQGHTGLKG